MAHFLKKMLIKKEKKKYTMCSKIEILHQMLLAKLL